MNITLKQDMKSFLIANGYSEAGLRSYTETEIENLFYTLAEGKLREIDKHHPSQAKFRSYKIKKGKSNES